MKGQITKHRLWHWAAILFLLVETFSDNTRHSVTPASNSLTATCNLSLPVGITTFHVKIKGCGFCTIVLSLGALQSQAAHRNRFPSPRPSQPRRQNPEYGSAFCFVLCLEPYENTM